MKYEVLAIKANKQISLTTVDAESMDNALDIVQEQLTLNHFWGLYCKAVKTDVRKLSLIARPHETTEYKQQQLN